MECKIVRILHSIYGLLCKNHVKSLQNWLKFQMRYANLYNSIFITIFAHKIPR